VGKAFSGGETRKVDSVWELPKDGYGVFTSYGYDEMIPSFNLTWDERKIQGWQEVELHRGVKFLIS
jgi:hypothetical protein